MISETYRLHFENMNHTGKIVLDKTFQIVECNDIILTTFGYEREELIGLHINDITPIKAHAHHNSSEASGDINGMVLFEGKHKSGEIFPVLIDRKRVEGGGIDVAYLAICINVAGLIDKQDTFDHTDIYERLDKLENPYLQIVADATFHSMKLNYEGKQYTSARTFGSQYSTYLWRIVYGEKFAQEWDSKTSKTKMSEYIISQIVT